MMCAPQNPVVLAITGGIACGKSEVGRILEGLGFAVCDADHVAHELMKKGSRVYQQVVDFFGRHILSTNGEISRPTLGKDVFENPEKREELNRLVHPAVQERLKQWVADVRLKNQNAAVLVPLLFESKMESLEWDAIICVSSSEQQILERLEKRGCGRKEAGQRINAQMPLEEKEKRSDHVIQNIGSLGELEQSTRATVNRISAER